MPHITKRLDYTGYDTSEHVITHDIHYCHRTTGERNSQRKWLKGSTVMPERHMCTQRCTLQLNSVANKETTLTTVHQLRQNETSNKWDLDIVTAL